MNLPWKLEHVIKELREYKKHQRRQAEVEGTHKYLLLQQKNQEVKKYNDALPREKWCNKQRLWTPKAYTKTKYLYGRNSEGCLDFIWYAFEVYEKLFFPYYERIKELNPGKEIWITEDNMGVHHKARRLLEGLIFWKDVKFADHPANSPDIHPIEHLYGEQKRILKDYEMGFKSASKRAQEEGLQKLRDQWCGKDFDGHCRRWALIDGYKELARLSKAVNPPYSSRFKV